MYYFYLLQSIKKPNEIYTGSTNNLRSRFSDHNQGKVFSTKRYLPWRLIYYEAYLSEKDARLREQKFKRHGKGNQELKKRLEDSLKIFKKGVYPSPFLIHTKKDELNRLPLTFLAKKGEGFTLMELMISLAIFLFITGLVIVNFRSGQYRDELVGAAEGVQTAVREMQTATNAGDTVECVPTIKEPPDNGFGVQLVLDSASALAFGDCVGSPQAYQYDNPPQDVKVKDITWSTRAPISAMTVDGSNANPLDITFSPTSEVVRLEGSDQKTNSTITLKHKKTGKEAMVKINAITGQVFITY